MELNPFKLIVRLTEGYNILNSHFFSDYTLGLVYSAESKNWTISTADGNFSIVQNESDIYELRMVVGESFPIEQMPMLIEQMPVAHTCLPGKLEIQDIPGKEAFCVVYSLRVSARQLSRDLNLLLEDLEDDLSFFSSEVSEEFSESSILNFDKLGENL